MNRQLLDLLFKEGVLDEQQFLELQPLQDESTPNFTFVCVNMYIRESENCLKNIRGMLEFSDYKNLAFHADNFMECSLYMGAKRLRKPCVDLLDASKQNNRAGCLRALELLEHEFYYLKNRLQQVIQIEWQRLLRSRY